MKDISIKCPDAVVKKIYLSEHNINHCRDCLTCWRNRSDDPIAKCVIRDDMDSINQDILEADALIMGTPVHMGYAPALMVTFLERICWTFAKPEKNYLIIKGCPTPRSDKKRKAVVIAVSGLVAPKYKYFCNSATQQIKGVIKDSLNAKSIGELYAGDVWHRGVDYYSDKACKLGQKLAQKMI